MAERTRWARETTSASSSTPDDPHVKGRMDDLRIYAGGLTAAQVADIAKRS